MNKYFNQLSFKQKNKYLVVGAGAFALIAYLFAISHTVSAYRRKNILEQKVAKAKGSPQQISAMENRLTFINAKVNTYIVDSTRGHEHLLDAVSTFCQHNNIILREFPKSSYEEQKDITIESNVIIAEGNFINLLKLVYELENKNKLGKVASVSFNSSMDNKQKRLILTAKMYLQNIRIKNKSNEKS